MINSNHCPSLVLNADYRPLSYFPLSIWSWKDTVKAVFLDRDGVINIDYGFVHSMDNFKYIEGAKEMIKMANDFGILVIVVTNQSGIARGYYTEEEFKLFTEEINEDLKNFDAHIDATYFCPHHPKEGIGKLRKDCDCRKPKTGLLMKAIKEWNLDKNKCFAAFHFLSNFSLSDTFL